MYTNLTVCIKWLLMYMLNKLLPGVSFCKTTSIKCCKAQTFSAKESEKVLSEADAFFAALSSGKHADEWTRLSLSYLFISPNWANPISTQAIFLLSEKSWHVGVHRILINGSLKGRGLGLTLSQIPSKPWSDAQGCRMHVQSPNIRGLKGLKLSELPALLWIHFIVTSLSHRVGLQNTSCYTTILCFLYFVGYLH